MQVQIFYSIGRIFSEPNFDLNLDISNDVVSIWNLTVKDFWGENWAFERFFWTLIPLLSLSLNFVANIRFSWRNKALDDSVHSDQNSKCSEQETIRILCVSRGASLSTIWIPLLPWVPILLFPQFYSVFLSSTPQCLISLLFFIFEIMFNLYILRLVHYIGESV